LEHRGFAFVEVLSTCPTQYGRRNDLADPVAMLRDLKARCVTLGRAARMGPEELKEKIVVGEFVGG